MQTFGVLNIADQPLSYIKTGSLILIIAALAIPLLSWATQMLNLKLMPQAATQNGNDDNNAMASSMKTMNTVMPLMSAFFWFYLPGRSWYLLDRQCGSKKYSAAAYQPPSE